MIAGARGPIPNLGRISIPRRVGEVEVEVESFGFFAMIPDVDFVLGVQTLDELELNYCHANPWATARVIAEVADGVEAIIDAAIGRPARGVARALDFDAPGRRPR